LSTDATQPPARFIVTEPETLAPPPALTRPVAIPASRAHARRWRDPGGRETVRPSIAIGWSTAGLAVMVLASLLLVSLAASAPTKGVLVPTAYAHDDVVPRWITGPTGFLTAWISASSHLERVLFTVAIPVMLAAYLFVIYSASRLRPALVLGTIVVLHVIFLLSPPLSLTDVFNYLNYGRMQYVYHLNPYTTIPALEPHGDPTFLLSNWHGLLSPYGPLFTLFTVGLAPLGVATSFWAMKATLMLASLGIVFLTYRCAQMLGRNPVAAAVIVGINPIVLVWGLGGDHNDFLMLFFIVLAFWLLLRASTQRVGRRAPPPAPEPHGFGYWVRRGWAWLDGMPRPLVEGEPAPWMEVGAGVALVAAVAIKASSAVLIPIIICGAARRTRVAFGVLIGAVATVAMTYYAFGVNLPNLGQQDRLIIPEGIPNMIGYAFGLGGATAAVRTGGSVLLIVAIVVCSIWAWRTRRWLTACGWATFALIVSLSWALPWYIAWLLPFVALSRSRGLRIAAVLLGVYTYLAWMPYSSEVLAFLHINPTHTLLGQQEKSFMNSLLY
jgi:4-amino-4-deoxy-L-arabinose transferase-like glycosyltransferase